MFNLNKCFVASFLVLLIVTCPSLTMGSKVFHYLGFKDPLKTKWSWALDEAKKQGIKGDLWIGYSIKRLMDEYSYIYSSSKGTMYGSFSFHSSSREKPLGEILYGKKYSIDLSDQEKVKLAAEQAISVIEDKEELRKKVWKDVAIFIKLSSRSSKIPEAIRLNNITMPFDPENLPLFWLNSTKENDSIPFLTNLYKNPAPEKIKKRILTAVGFHGNSELVVPFLEKVLKSNEPETLRGRAASELGDHNTKRVLEMLFQTVKKDRSYEVRKRAVYALEDLELEGATDALIDIARDADNSEIRKKAIYALADKASKKAVAALEDFVYEDEDTEVQKRAVYALEDLPNSQGVPLLIKIAKTHPKSTIRKRAIYCLGDTKDPRALKALIEILQKK